MEVKMEFHGVIFNLQLTTLQPTTKKLLRSFFYTRPDFPLSTLLFPLKKGPKPLKIIRPP